VAFGEILVVLLTGVLHDFPVGSERKYSGVLPRLGKGLGIVDSEIDIEAAEETSS